MAWEQLTRLGGYLHQDWPLDYDDAGEAIRAFKGDLTAAELEEAVAEVTRITEQHRSEDDLRRVLVDELRIDYWPPGDGLTFRSWFDDLERILRDPA